MRLFTLIASVAFVAIGIWMIVDRDPTGWWVSGFFAMTFLVAVFEPMLARMANRPEYRVVITEEEIACEHPKRPREAIRWAEVDRIWYVTTSQGPRLPDEWLLLESKDRGCSFPTEAEGMNAVWDELQRRFGGFDYGPLIRGGTSDAKHLCWERK